MYSENAEIIGQHLTLPRWIQIISARIKGLKSVTQDNGKKTYSTYHDCISLDGWHRRRHVALLLWEVLGSATAALCLTVLLG